MNQLESVFQQWAKLYKENEDLRRVIYESKGMELAFRNPNEQPYDDEFIVEFIKYRLDPYCVTEYGKIMHTVKERKGKIPGYEC